MMKVCKECAHLKKDFIKNQNLCRHPNAVRLGMVATKKCRTESDLCGHEAKWFEEIK